MDHWDAVLPRGRIMRVPYEALVTDQEGMTRRILDFVGLAWEPEVLRFHETLRAVQTASLGQVRFSVWALLLNLQGLSYWPCWYHSGGRAGSERQPSPFSSPSQAKWAAFQESWVPIVRLCVGIKAGRQAFGHAWYVQIQCTGLPWHLQEALRWQYFRQPS